MTRPIPQDYKRGKKQPNIKRITIAYDSEVADRFAEAKDRLDSAKQMADLKRQRPKEEREQAITEMQDAQLEFNEAKDAIDEESQTFVFRSIGRRAYETLLMDHQPTPEQVAQAKKQGDGEFNWNPDSFPPALLAASLVSPILDEADIKDIWEGEDWSASETMSLFMCAMEANSTHRILDIPKGSGRTGGLR